MIKVYDVVLLLLLCVFIPSCARGLGQNQGQNDFPKNIIPGSFQFSIRDQGRNVTGWSGAANFSGKKMNILILYKDSQFDRMVPRPSLYSQGKKVNKPADVLIDGALKARGLDLSALSPYSEQEDDAGREPMNIAPAFIILAPLVAGELLPLAGRTSIALGTPASRLPKGTWIVDSGYLVNYKSALAVKIQNDHVIQVIAGSFFESQFHNSKLQG